MTLLRRLIYALCTVTLSLGLGTSLAQLLQCLPLISNFVWSVPQTSCFDLDIPRFTWIGVSVFIDLCFLAIPFAILHGTRIQQHEKRVLFLVFAGNFLGTIVCIVSIYSAYETRSSLQYFDLAYTQTAFATTNDVEILFYTLGASLPVLSPFLVARWKPRERIVGTTTSRMPSWRVKGGSSIPASHMHVIPSTASGPKRGMTMLETCGEQDGMEQQYDQSYYSGSTLANHATEIRVQFDDSQPRERVGSIV